MDSYSRLIAWLKVLLPLAALALLSTLFLLSRNVDPFTTVPFAETELESRLRDEQITGPFFSGSTDRGDRLAFSAVKLVSAGVGSGDNIAEDLTAQIDLASGSRVTVAADSGSFDIQGGHSVLVGNVVMTTSTGYRVTTDQMDADTIRLNLVSPGPVVGTGPIGTLHAGTMYLRAPNDEKAAQLVFTNGVKLVYEPKQTQE